MFILFSHCNFETYSLIAGHFCLILKFIVMFGPKMPWYCLPFDINIFELPFIINT